MLYTYFNNNSFFDSYNIWSDETAFAFGKEEGISLVEHNGEKYIGVEKLYLNYPADGKKIKYLLNDATFYKEAFPKNDVVLGVHILYPSALYDEDDSENLSIISLLIPINTPRRKMRKIIRWFREVKTLA